MASSSAVWLVMVRHSGGSFEGKGVVGGSRNLRAAADKLRTGLVDRHSLWERQLPKCFLHIRLLVLLDFNPLVRLDVLEYLSRATRWPKDL